MRLQLFFVVVFSLAVYLPAGAQSRQPTPPPPVMAEKTEAELAAERLLLQRQANAQSLLINLAVDARHFKDDTTRARALARIADMLWENDQDRSRSLFRSAWDAAENGDAKGRERALEDLRQQRAANPGGGYSRLDPGDLRREVLDLAARRDRTLTEEFLDKYRDQKARETAAEPGRSQNTLVADEATRQRFALATDLLRDGEIERALHLADPAMSSINIQSIGFLVRLRERNAAAADGRYAAMLTSAPNNPQSEANTVSLLASYLFTPHVYVVFLPRSTTAQSGRPAPPINAPASLRSAFFQAAAAILLRPLGDSLSTDSDSQYLALRRIMPLFDQYAPAEINRAIRTHLEGLTAAASDKARNRDDQFTRAPIDGNDRPPNRNDQATRPGPDARNPSSDEQSLLERRERANTADERDQLNLQLALAMVESDDSRARAYVEKIDDMDLRNEARGYIDASIAWKLVQKKDVDRAIELVRTGQLTHFQKAWLLSSTARALGNGDREKFISLIETATTEARRIETSDPDRPRAFIAIANVVFNFNRAAIWEAMGDAVKAANSAEKFTGEDGKIAFRLNRNGINSSHQHGFSDFDIAAIFKKLANEDYDKTVELARAIQHETPGANATIAIATAVLKEKKK
ncbi:MAG TPA: hypothetical protein VFX97_16615 [Pyrinomonadaceae bacterium]|nr:hypothetical protein [Pyrinomonadaceae bacterium]